jgi:SpoVK/Ycf46/Vps4 family AAA+-type ATPase
LAPLKNELKFHYGLAMAKIPDGMEIEGWQNIMFYGPPGTGKTLLACAIANKLSATFFNVKASQIVSKWVGESGKLISALYRLARKFTRDGQPSIIFIDEFDALCKSRGHEGQLYHQQMLAAILGEIDGFASKGRRDLVMTIGATNRPWDLDAAVLSRFERRILIDLPSAEARADIFKIHLEGKGIPVDHRSLDYAKLAQRTPQLTGREIARLCKDVTAHMLAEMNPAIPDLVDEGLKAIQQYDVKTRSLVAGDFYARLDGLVPDTSDEDLERFSAWGRRLSEIAD